MSNIEKEILLASYWEHFNMAKSLSMIYDITDHRRIRIEKEVNKITQQLQKFKNHEID